ncbi:MAG TPA: 7-carboxy-7-deazaguanine synthase QueE, partial [Thiobacillus sp.]|nr:7-carboxy-7-deazaguanine synthase QueE [Thiobacillus sp.]
DTPYSFQGGDTVTLRTLLARVADFGVPTVCVTGGEPLAQKNCLPLLAALCDAGYSVSLETSGALDVSQVDARVSRIVDIKPPASGEAARNRWENLAHLTSHDEIKFVLADRADYEWAREVLQAQNLAKICTILFSPVQGELPPAQLAEWIIGDRLPVRMQVQLHKVLWGNTPGK